jgi:2-polyprenyl-3-methyl-5-hydroxy-6-metoxy-1,4-benzoquinol methylase
MQGDSKEQPAINNTVQGVYDVARELATVRGTRPVNRRGKTMDTISKEKWEKGEHKKTITGNYRHHMAKRERYVGDLIQRFTTPDMKAIELGCGDGNNLELLSKYFKVIYACDNNPVRVERARNTFPHINVTQNDVTNLHIHERFDFVLLNHVLEHLPDTSHALNGIYKIMNKQGLLLIGIPNEGALFWKFAYRIQPKSLENTEHIQFFTKNSIIEQCEKAGFTIAEFKYIGWGVPQWSVDSRIRRYKIFDDLFEFFGRRLIPSQATSMYVLVRK